MELRHIRYFLAVAEESNVTRAAERLGIGQPPLSHQIHALEKEIGTRLFRRTGHGVVLTEAGEAFAIDAKKLLQDARQAVEKAQSAARGELGQLNIGFTGSAAFNPIVAKLIQAYRQAFPSVNLTLAEGNTSQLLDLLHNGSVDVAFVRLGGQSPTGVQLDHIAVESMRIVLPSTHPLAKKRRVALSDLSEDPFVLLPRAVSPTLHDVILDACVSAGFVPRAGQQAPQLSSVVNLVAAGFGVSLVPSSVSQIRIDGITYADVLHENVSIRLALASRSDATDAKTSNFIAIARTVPFAAS
jgi:DNA-binding transcriptional LysR family regulator